MTDEVDPVVRGIDKRFRDLSVSVRGERVIRYIVKQLRFGRPIDEILGDTYLIAQTSPVQRAELLENPAVIRVIEEEIRKQFAGYRSVTDSETS
ncbi:MAG: hypothetical protein GX630_07210 [Actinobacteria bacterium]|nr:hypothetical protein [Actinomycetota bacterium]